MTTITLSDILDDLWAADQALRKFEQRYRISSADFYKLYSQGKLDDGQHREDCSEWAGHYKLKLKREAALENLSQQQSDQETCHEPSRNHPSTESPGRGTPPGRPA